MALLELALMGQEGRALHEEHREGGHAEVAHAIGRVDAAALVRKPVQAAAQRSEQGIERAHAHYESHFERLANPRFAPGERFVPTVAFETHCNGRDRDALAFRAAACRTFSLLRSFRKAMLCPMAAMPASPWRISSSAQNTGSSRPARRTGSRKWPCI